MASETAATILTSGIGLGVYMPALFIQQQMRREGVDVDIEVLEGYYTDAHQERHLAHKRAYHDNFRLALLAHRASRGVEQSLDEGRIEALLEEWARRRATRFIVWSGFWLPVLEEYRSRIDAPLGIDCCRIDAVVSASFRAHDGLAADANEIWLWNWEQKRTVFEIPVTDEPPVPFAVRDHRVVVHGGGWNLGTYRDAAAEMRTTGWGLDVVVHDPAEAVTPATAERFYMVAPAWRTWHRDDGHHRFPPFAEVGSQASPGDEHSLYRIIRRSKAIVSKPGGGTLLDSLSSATPVVLLEPYGYAEESNGALWEHLGYGIAYAKWRALGFDPAVLERLHANLLARRQASPSYPQYCVDRIRTGSWS